MGAYFSPKSLFIGTVSPHEVSLVTSYIGSDLPLHLQTLYKLIRIQEVKADLLIFPRCVFAAIIGKMLTLF